MKTTITLLTLAASLFVQLSYGRGKIPLPFGSKEKIIHIMDLPDQKEFRMGDGRYFDLGSIYKIDHVFWLAFWHSKPQLVGYLGNSDEYVVLTPSELRAIEKTVDIDGEAKAVVGFMDKIGSRIILCILTLLALYRIYTSYFPKVTASPDEEERIAF